MFYIMTDLDGKYKVDKCFLVFINTYGVLE